VQGHTGWFNVQRTLRNFHMNLSLPSVGIYLVSSLGFVLLLSLISALLFYKRWWRRFFVVRLGKGWRVFWSDAHRASGLWSLWFILIIAVTGIWYFIEMAMFDAGIGLSDTPEPRPAIRMDHYAPQGEWPERLPMTDLVASVQEAYPELNIAYLYQPTDPAQAVQFSGQANAWLVRDRANGIFVNPYDAAIMGLYRAEDLPLAYRWSHTSDPLHFGDFGGLVSKLIWFVFGLLSSGLCLSGAYLWFKRHQQRIRGSTGLGSTMAQSAQEGS